MWAYTRSYFFFDGGGGLTLLKPVLIFKAEGLIYYIVLTSLNRFLIYRDYVLGLGV